jgi:hypothetical protein
MLVTSSSEVVGGSMNRPRPIGRSAVSASAVLLLFLSDCESREHAELQRQRAVLEQRLAYVQNFHAPKPAESPICDAIVRYHLEQRRVAKSRPTSAPTNACQVPIALGGSTRLVGIRILRVSGNTAKAITLTTQDGERRTGHYEFEHQVENVGNRWLVTESRMTGHGDGIKLRAGELPWLDLATETAPCSGRSICSSGGSLVIGKRSVFYSINERTH